MKISTQNANRLINRFDAAAQDFAWKGAAHPDDWQKIEERYARERKRLFKFVCDCIIELGDDKRDRS